MSHGTGAAPGRAGGAARSRGIATVALPERAVVRAAPSGLPLGIGGGAIGVPVVARLFRPQGTRLAAVAALPLVQLLVLRAAAAGVSVRVLTARSRQWSPLLPAGDAGSVLAPGSSPALADGPALIVDDRPDDTRRLGENGPWWCRVDVRSPVTAADMRTLTGADLLLLGGVLPDVALAATAGMGVSVPSLTALTTPAAGTIAVLRRGALTYVTLDPTPDEAAALRAVS